MIDIVTAEAEAVAAEVAARVAGQPWDRLHADLDERGAARTGVVLSEEECAEITALRERSALFREEVPMTEVGYGVGELRVFDYPHPPFLAALRSAFYSHLQPLANRWRTTLGTQSTEFPARLEDFLARCRASGQHQPGPLLNRYGKDGFIRIHQDADGEHIFPLQMVFLLSKPGTDFEGGLFTMIEEREPTLHVPDIVPLEQGEAVIFTGHTRPRFAADGSATPVTVKHGLTPVRSGYRTVMTLTFHDFVHTIRH